MMLEERIAEAVKLLSSDPGSGTIHKQAEYLLGGEVSRECLSLLKRMANEVWMQTFEAAILAGDPMAALEVSRTAVLIAGMAVGKRLGAEEGEEFGRITAQFDSTRGVEG